MRIDNGSGSNGTPPIGSNNTIIEGPPPPNGATTANPAPNPIESHIPTLNNNIDHQIQAIQNYNEDCQQALINQIQEFPEEHIERLTNIFLNTQEELSLEVLQAFVSRLASPDKHSWDNLLKNTFSKTSKTWIKIQEENNNYKLNDTVTNILNMYLLLFKIKDVNSLQLSDSLHDSLNTIPNDTFYDFLNCVLRQIVTSKITAIQEKFPSYTTKSANTDIDE